MQNLCRVSLGHKLVCSSLTIEKAVLLGKALAGERAIIFIDNVVDSTPAFRFLMKLANVQVVGVERDVLYEQISHLVTSRQVRIIQITDLSPADIQGVVNSLPVDLKRDYLVQPKTEGSTQPSLFEVIEMNTRQPPIKNRLGPVLRQLEYKDVNRHDFLVMCAYVHACRTPVSFDMAYAFMKEQVPSYNDVYEMVRSLHSFVVDYDGTLVDDEEDYFVPRSTIVSYAIIKCVSSASLKRVLLQFHQEVSPYRIAHYDIFKRKAYDENYATHAFNNPDEGKAYFEMLSRRDDSASIRQQAALYLMHRGLFSEAFQWIDEALSSSGGRNPSIRNTHAIILFRANIGQAATGSSQVRDTLKRSMSILADCYQFDKRKNYHATVFGDQAVQYWKAYRDPDAKAYLVTALEWLTEEAKRSPWHRRLNEMVSLVEKTLVRAN